MCEKCQRCGQVGEDRRTIWMSCFYQMDELDIPPLEQVRIVGSLHEKIGTKVIGTTEFPKFSESSDNAIEQIFYWLRVCKSCRADWMQAVESWFNTVPITQTACGSGIFVREHGAIREITEGEWHTRYPDQEPVRVVGASTDPEK